MTRVIGTVLRFVILVSALETAPVFAHSLGIDPAELNEHADGTYMLRTKVPQMLAYLITAPELPERCALSGNPRGQRGPAEVRYAFTCNEPLTARDSLVLPWQREGVLLTVTWADGTSASRMVMREGVAITVDLILFQAGSGSWLAAAERYLGLGIEHILLGIDHLLFVLALLLMVRGPLILLKTITAFTVAHSITLALATLSVIEMPSQPVEAAIALSIVFVCIEIVHARQGRVGLTYRYPWVVAFAFGLLHGLGFAGALAEIGFPPPEIPLALLFFNIGVEIGQLIFVVSVLVGIAAWSLISKSLQAPSWTWVRTVTVYVIGTLATYWFIERAATILPAP